MAKKKADKKKKGASKRGKAGESKKVKEEESKRDKDAKKNNLAGLPDECLFSDMVRISYDEFKNAPQEILNHFLNPDTITHLIRAGIEGYEVVRNIEPGERLPEETKLHLHRAEKEFLLAVKAAMELRISDLDGKIDDEEKRCGIEPKSDKEKGLKQITVKD
jgi:hypothetical protein